MELNPTHYSWLVEFYQKNPIPKVCAAATCSSPHRRGSMRGPRMQLAEGRAASHACAAHT